MTRFLLIGILYNSKLCHHVSLLIILSNAILVVEWVRGGGEVKWTRIRVRCRSYDGLLMTEADLADEERISPLAHEHRTPSLVSPVWDHVSCLPSTGGLRLCSSQ